MAFSRILFQSSKLFLSGVLIFALSWGLMGCGDRIESKVLQSPPGDELESLAEAAPPQAFVELDRSLLRYQPQVTIVSPKTEEIIADTQVSVAVRVDDLPIYRDRDLGLGPHVAVILDNEPMREVYDLEEALVLEDVAPGTHTLRVFAVKPWGESFKNEGAYAQTTFSLFTPTPQNTPNTSQPILTYNSPQGDYGAEPILLDFYVANAPLHLVAQESNNDEIADWRIRVTANGKSFLLDRWSPIYLKGFEPGINWVKLEFLDEYGNPVNNTFNTSVGLFNYQPGGKDTLSLLINGELAALDASPIVDPNYKPIETAPIIVEDESEEVPTTDEEVILESPENESIELEEISPSEPSQELTSEEELLEENASSQSSQELILDETTTPEEEILEESSSSQSAQELIPDETTTPEEEILEEEIPMPELEQEPISVENNVKDTESSVSETENIESTQETPIDPPSENFSID